MHCCAWQKQLRMAMSFSSQSLCRAFRQGVRQQFHPDHIRCPRKHFHAGVAPPAVPGSSSLDIDGMVEAAVKRARSEIVDGLKGKGWAEVNSFFGAVAVTDAMRLEAATMYECGRFAVSQSTRWVTETDTVEYYDKQNVFSTSVKAADGDNEGCGPVLHAYALAIARSLGLAVAVEFPEAQLCRTIGLGLTDAGDVDKSLMPLNKLAVCIGSGSSYAAHYDNIGPGDMRKLTVLIYLNKGWRPECGGWFRIHNAPSGSTAPTLVEPSEDTLLVFWADQLVHSVLPSLTPGGSKDDRYAFTVWLTARCSTAILRDKTTIARHFSAKANHA